MIDNMHHYYRLKRSKPGIGRAARFLKVTDGRVGTAGGTFLLISQELARGYAGPCAV